MKAILLVLFCAFFANTNLFAQQFDKTEYYNILKKGSISEINNEIALIDAYSLQG